MTMRTLLTAAAIISSAGFGLSQSPGSDDSFHPPDGLLALAGVDVRQGEAFVSLDKQTAPLPP